MNPSTIVVKLGGSVLTGLAAYRNAAAFLATLVSEAPARRVVAVVSAEYGHTDALAREAAELSVSPDRDALDLLWSTGELRSVALLTFALRDAGVSTAALNAHEAGIGLTPDGYEFNTIRLKAALARQAVVVVPGFLATRRQQIVTLGRGGSDLSAVLLAEALDAGGCVLVKDVDGYYSADPAVDRHAQPIPELSHEDAVAMADAGCPLVQRQALVVAGREGMTLVVRSISGRGTIVRSGLNQHSLPSIASTEVSADRRFAAASA